jgi:hypothetical protein
MSAKDKKVSEPERQAQAERLRIAQAEQKKALERERHAQAERDRTALAESERGRRRKLVSWTLSVAGGLATLFGVYASLVGLETRISMSSDAPINPSDIMSAPFIVSNDGQLDVHDVSYGCVNRKILSDIGMTIIANGPYKKIWMGGLATPTMVADLIQPTGKQAFTCPMPFVEKGHVTYGDMIIAVSYRPDWWPFRRQIHKRFATALDADRKPVRWYEQPMPKE